jgi:hypothetical protein
MFSVSRGSAGRSALGRRAFGVLGAFALVGGSALAYGCGSTSEGSITLPPADAGPDAVSVFLDGGGPIAVPPDGAAECPTGACNYQTGAGCSGAASSCLPAVSGATAAPTCFAAGTAASGGACTQATDCVAGHICVAGTCRKLCCGGDWTGCDTAAEHCIDTLDYSGDGGSIVTGAMVCLPVNTCNALEPTAGCATQGTSCQLVDATGATACIPQGTGTSGQPCPCQGGFTCVTPKDGASVCVRLCRAVVGGGSPYCAASEGICTHYNRDPAGVGECQPPTP